MNKIMLYLVLVMAFAIPFVHAAASTTSTSSPDTAAVRVTMLNQDPDPAVAGDTVDLRFSIENLGTEAISGLQFEVVQNYPFTVVAEPENSNSISLSAHQTEANSVNLKYTVKIDKDAEQGQQQVQVRFKYGNQPWANADFNINVKNREFAQIIYIDKAQLNPGKETDMTFTITNVGNAPLQNMVFSWSEPHGVVLPVYSGSSKYIKYLDAGQSVDLTYKVIADVNAAAGLYQLNLVLKSDSTTNSTPSTLTTNAGVFVGGETDFDVAFSESSAGQTSLSVSNTGNNPAQSVSVTIPAQQNYRVTGTNSAIIGNLAKGDYTLVSFQITSATQSNFTGAGRQTGQQVQNLSPEQQSAQAQQMQNLRNNVNASNRNFNASSRGGSNNLLVQIDYTDTTGQRKTVEKSVAIQFRSAGTGTGTTGTGRASASSGGITLSTTWLVVIGVVLIVFVLFVFINKNVRQGFSGAFKKKEVARKYDK